MGAVYVDAVAMGDAVNDPDGEAMVQEQQPLPHGYNDDHNELRDDSPGYSYDGNTYLFDDTVRS